MIGKEYEQERARLCARRDMHLEAKGVLEGATAARADLFKRGVIGAEYNAVDDDVVKAARNFEAVKAALGVNHYE